MYNRENHLLRIIEIQTIVLQHDGRGLPRKWVYENIIYPRYRISRTTFYKYLSINAKKQLKQLLKNENI